MRGGHLTGKQQEEQKIRRQDIDSIIIGSYGKTAEAAAPEYR